MGSLAAERPTDFEHPDRSPAERIGLARLTKLAFEGGDLRPLWNALLTKVQRGQGTHGDVLDLSVIAQLHGDKALGLALQRDALAGQRLFLSPCAAARPALRVLALAAPLDMGGNMPIEFLLEGSDVELITLYVVPGRPLPDPLPEHDIAVVVASECEESREALIDIGHLAMRWPRPLLNPPGRIADLDRDRLHCVIAGIPGLAIPPTIRVPRDALLDERAFPITVRPPGSHGGVGLAKINDRRALETYLAERSDAEFFVSPFIDYSGADGLFRKYRVAVIDGVAFPGHMAILDQWNIWYLNAGMTTSAAKRAEEAAFMSGFETGFGARHRDALAEMAARLGLEYFTVDCAEDKNGRLLIFEADHTAIIHNMDPPELFPYKPPQMRKLFAAFVDMLKKRAASAHADA
ncbi:MAG TPA: hypothetical protein VFB45_09590 [Pseudolabrys sp.]|nr:hypothetical protein [Pseudolabrys sp.]